MVGLRYLHPPKEMAHAIDVILPTLSVQIYLHGQRPWRREPLLFLQADDTFWFLKNIENKFSFGASFKYVKYLYFKVENTWNQNSFLSKHVFVESAEPSTFSLGTWWHRCCHQEFHTKCSAMRNSIVPEPKAMSLLWTCIIVTRQFLDWSR